MMRVQCCRKKLKKIGREVVAAAAGVGGVHCSNSYSRWREPSREGGGREK